MSRYEHDRSRAAIDRELEEVAGVATWTEHIHGGTAVCRMNGRHLRAVLRARGPYLAGRPSLRLVLPGLRLVEPTRDQHPNPFAPRDRVA